MARQTSPKTNLKKIFSSKIFLFIATLVLIFLSISLIKETYRKYQLNKEIERLQAEIERLEGDDRQLNNVMGYLQEESYTEKEARLKLNLKKSGETVVVFSGGRNNLEEKLKEDDSTERKIEDVPNYWKWWEYFFAS